MEKNECIWIVFFFLQTKHNSHRIPRQSNFSVSSLVAPFEMKQKTHTQNTAKNRLQSFKGSNLKAPCISPGPDCPSAAHSKRDWLISRILFLRPLSTWFLLSWLLLWLDCYLFFWDALLFFILNGFIVAAFFIFYFFHCLFACAFGCDDFISFISFLFGEQTRRDDRCVLCRQR